MNSNRISVLVLGTLFFAACATVNPAAPVSQSAVDDLISTWPPTPREVAQKIVGQYGPPDEATASMLVWHNSGPWKRTIVYREEVPHSFPKPHTDLLEQFIDYRVPTDRFDELAEYDGSVIVERTKGEISARCDKEPMNFLALNLANDIITGRRTVEEARRFYADTAMATMRGENPPYVQRLQFQPQPGRRQDPDRPLIQK